MGKGQQIAKHKHQQQFQESGPAINDKVRLYGQIGHALLEAKRTGADPFAATENQRGFSLELKVHLSISLYEWAVADAFCH